MEKYLVTEEDLLRYGFKVGEVSYFDEFEEPDRFEIFGSSAIFYSLELKKNKIITNDPFWGHFNKEGVFIMNCWPDFKGTKQEMEKLIDFLTFMKIL